MTINPVKMKKLFDPGAVAVVGASDKFAKLGFHVMKSLVEGDFGGDIIPVNPGAGEIMGIKAFQSLAGYGGAIDLAIVVVPAARVPVVFAECVEKEVQAIVLITAGFKEIDDPSGADLHKKIAGIVDAAGIPVIGPNTFGMINFHKHLNASFTPEFSQIDKGGIALVSQSGGISHLLGFLAMRTNAALSKIVGLGNRLNVDFPDMIDFLMEDPDTRVIMLYLEGIDQPGRLVAAVKKHRRKKPVIAFKTGSSQKGDLAAKSHTGSLAGRHDIYQGALRQAGILTRHSAEDLLDTARVLDGCPTLRGPGVAVLSGQAGPGLAACDVCEARGLVIVDFQQDTQAAINQLLPPLALRTNPVDMGPAWYSSPATRGIIEAAMGDPEVAGILLLIMFASANVEMLKGLGDFLISYRQRKPVISCILAPPGVWNEEIRCLERSGALVNFSTPERAAAAMAGLWEYRALMP